MNSLQTVPAFCVRMTCRSPRTLSKAFISTNRPRQQETYFGCHKVTPEEKRDRVSQVFSNVAGNYDFMNDIMSVGIHRMWKCCVINTLNPMPGTKLLDVAGGTGDIAFRFLDYMKSKHRANYEHKVTVCDINQEMLERGEKKAQSSGYNDPRLIEWVLGDAQKLPFPDNSFDAYTIAFGIRNVVDINLALQESHRVLRPGGMFLCLEFSKMNTPLLNHLYDWYSFNIIPVVGELVAGDWKSYQYLVESIRQFPDQRDFAEMIKNAGFHLVEYRNLSQGIAALHWGYKKDDSVARKLEKS